MSRNRIALVLAACVAQTLSYAASTGGIAFAKSQLPADLNRSLDRTTDNGSLRVQIASANDGVSMGRGK